MNQLITLVSLTLQIVANVQAFSIIRSTDVDNPHIENVTIHLKNVNDSVTNSSDGFSMGLPYSPNTLVTYIVYSDNKYDYQVTFDFFDLEGLAEDGSCAFDWFMIGGVQYCGNLSPFAFFDGDEVAVMTFKTNDRVQRFGYHFTVRVLGSADTTSPLAPTTSTGAPLFDNCGNSNTLNKVGDMISIWSNNYPNQYPNNAMCNNTVTGPSDAFLKLDLVKFMTEPDYDKLTLKYGDGHFKELSGDLTGKSYVIRSNVLVAEFESDFSNTDYGYYINVTAIQKPFECSWDQFKCVGENTCLNSENVCDGKMDCGDSSDENVDICKMRSVCGVNNVLPNTFVPGGDRIVGGSEAKPGSWPWAVSLHSVEDDFQFCGATLIADQWLVSAAHCFSDSDDPSMVKAKIGSHDKTLLETPYEQDIVLEKIFVHPDHNPSNNSHDISLLKLSKKVDLNERVNYACLPTGAYMVPDQTYCVIAGWGTTSEGGETSKTKQQALVPIVENSRCSDKDHYNGQIDITMLCAGYEAGGKDTCQGDSGGPLVCRDPNNSTRYVLQGITSWGYGCAEPHYPGVYGRVSELLNFLWLTISQN